MNRFVHALGEGVLVLDGGMSNQLEAQGQDLSDALWSARLLRDAPGAVVEAHAAYFAAGARVAITASYQASVAGFAAVGVGRGEAERLIGSSVGLAREAAERFSSSDGVERFVAASVGPYGAVLADGSEYRGRYGLSVRELTRFHRPRVEVLAAAGPDVLALETVPDVDEAEALLGAVATLEVPVWLSYSIAGGRTRAGQSLEEAFATAAGVDQVVAVGVNCCAPEDADRAVGVAREVSGGKPVVVYPNSGEGWDAGARGWTGTPTFRAERVSRWVRDGARLVGGCCRVGPQEIAAIAQALVPSPR